MIATSLTAATYDGAEMLPAYVWRDPRRSVWRARQTRRLEVWLPAEADSWDEPPALDATLYGCGTTAGYARHRRRHEKVCRPCRDAHNDETRAAYRSTHPAKPKPPAKPRPPSKQDEIEERLDRLSRMRVHDTSECTIPAGVMSVAEAAEQIGVTPRTLCRYRKILRERAAAAS